MKTLKAFLWSCCIIEYCTTLWSWCFVFRLEADMKKLKTIGRAVTRLNTVSLLCCVHCCVALGSERAVQKSEADL